MDVVTGAISAAVVPTTDATGRLRALDAASVTIRGGFWADRLRIDRERTIPHGFEQLVRAGNLTNLRLAAGEKGHYQALGEPLGLVFPFLDFGHLQMARGGRLGVGPRARPESLGAADEAIALVAAAQRRRWLSQLLRPGRDAAASPYRDMAWGHELYCIGHLVQAAVAWHRALGDDRLLDVAVRAVEHVDAGVRPRGTRRESTAIPRSRWHSSSCTGSTERRRYLELARG